MPQSFTELYVWEQAYKLILQVYSLTKGFPVEEKYGLTQQLRRLANSIAANIAESQGRFSFKDRIRVLYLARGETFETRSHLQIAAGLEFIDNNTHNIIDAEYEKLVK